MYKAIVSDVDGTLLNEEHKVSKFTMEIVKKVMEKGIKFYIASGRNHNQIYQAIKDMNLKIPVIASNGAQVYDEEGKLIYEQDLSEKSKEQVLSVDHIKIAPNTIFNAYSGEDWYLEEGFGQIIERDMPVGVKADYKEVKKEDFKELEILKFFYLGPNEELLKIEEAILEKAGNNKNFNIVFVTPTCLEIFSDQVNKANAAKILLKHEGIKLEETVTFGDGENDFELLTQIGKGYAMGNALDRLRSLLPENFEYVESNAEDGEAKKLEELFLK